MTNRIFRGVCAASLAVVCVTVALVLCVLYNYFTGVQQEQLRHETMLAASGAEQLGESFFEDVRKSDGSFRITWISADGYVLYDSASDSLAMENHLEREEIREALEKGHGESSRYSETLTERYLYCAERLDDGTVLRMSTAQKSILILILGMLNPVLLIIVIAAVMSFFLASRLAKRIVGPMNELDLNDPLGNDGYPELTPLLRRIHYQQQQITIQSETLRTRQKELDAIVGNMEEGMILLDSRNDVITINKAARILLEAGFADTGTNILGVSINNDLQEAVQTAAAGTSCTRKTEMKGRTVRISASPVKTDKGVSGTAVVLFDITGQERADIQRREFTANVSHELKTPLQSISGYSELLKCGMAAPDMVQPFSEKIYNESQRLIALVQDIINLSQLDEGGRGMNRTMVDLDDAAGRVIDELSDAAEQKGVTVVKESADSGGGGPEGESMIEVFAVPALVHDILYNLCENAIKYNRRGGSVTVTVGRHYVSVKDTGIGIPPEHLDRIFERFYRVDKSRSGEVAGTGLGLSIVKHAAMILGAEVEVDSKEGEGTEIRVNFEQ